MDATNSSVLRELSAPRSVRLQPRAARPHARSSVDRSPADSTPLLPAHAVALMRASGASGRYYGQYCARMFVGRDNDLPSSGTIGNAVAGAGPKSAGAEEGEEVPYALTAYELRRLLAAARAHGEPFTLTFTPSLPTAGARRVPGGVWWVPAGDQSRCEQGRPPIGATLSARAPR